MFTSLRYLHIFFNLWLWEISIIKGDIISYSVRILHHRGYTSPSENMWIPSTTTHESNTVSSTDTVTVISRCIPFQTINKCPVSQCLEKGISKRMLCAVYISPRFYKNSFGNIVSACDIYQPIKRWYIHKMWYITLNVHKHWDIPL